MSAVVGIVLAAGASRRMGQPKQLLPLDGRPLLQHVIDAAAASRLGEIVVVLGHEAAAVRQAIRLPARARLVVNDRYADGQSGSLACGLAAAGSDPVAAAVLLGDQPRVGPTLIDTILAAFLAGTSAAVRPVWRDRSDRARPGHPVVLARRVWADVARLTGDRGARALFETHPDWVRELAIAGDPPADIDEPCDYRQMASGG